MWSQARTPRAQYRRLREPPPAGDPALIIARRRIEVTDLQGGPSDLGDRSGVVLDQLPQDPRAAFGRLVEEQPSTLRDRRQGLGRQFAVFELILDLDRRLQRGLQ